MANDVKKEYVSILAQINMDGTIQPLCVLLRMAVSMISMKLRISAEPPVYVQVDVEFDTRFG